MRRTNLDVSVNILETAVSGARKTKIVYQSNINFAIVGGYLDTLISGGLLAIDEKGCFKTTKKGAKFVKDYQNLMKPIQFY